MGGPKKENLQKENALVDRQIQLGERLGGQADERLAMQREYEAPMVTFLKTMVSGDRRSRLAANAPAIGEISTSAQRTREQLYDSMPAGAARDFAVAQTRRDSARDVSTLMNQTWLNAFPALASIGQSTGAQGLELLAGGMRSTESGQAGIRSINNRAAQQKASTLGLIGNIAGGVAGGFMGNPMAFGNMFRKPARGGFTGSLGQSGQEDAY